MPVLKFKDKDGVVKTTPGLKIITEKTQVNPNLNIHFGQTAPEDTSKLWVKTDKYPNDVIISPKITEEKNIMEYKIATLPVKDYGIGVAQVNGIIYMFGGQNSRTSIRKFDPETGEIITLNATLTVSGINCKTPIVYGKKIYIIPYTTDSSKSFMDIFDTETETLISVNNPCIYEGDCISVGDKIYHFGGNSTSIRVYNIKTNTWEYCPISLTSKRERVSIASVGSKIYLFGGRATNNYRTSAYDSIYIFDTENLTIQNSSVNLPSSIYGISTIAIGTDIYLFGGYSWNQSKRINTIMIYDTLTDTIRTLDTTLPLANNDMGITLYNTDVYLVGGYTSSGPTDEINKFSLYSILKNKSIQIQTVFDKTSLYKLMNNPLLETGIKKVFIGNENNYAQEIESYIYDYVPQFNKIEDKQYTSNCIQVDGAQSLSSTLNCSIGDLIIASIITRDTFTLSDGWTLISTSELNSEYVSGNGQRLSFAYKYAENTTETITVTQASSQRLYITTIALQGATGFIDNGYSYANSQSSTSISVTKPEGLTLLACSADIWGSSTPYPLWTVSDNSEIIQLGTSTQSRLGVILDQNTEMSELNIVPGGTSSPIVVGSLTITGMDKFYDVNEWSGGEMWKLL